MSYNAKEATERFVAITHILAENDIGYIDEKAVGERDVDTYICEGIVIVRNSDGTFEVFCDRDEVNVDAVRKVVAKLNDPKVSVVDQKVDIFA